MVVSKNSVYPKMDGLWFIMKNPIKMDDLGGFPPIFGSTPIWIHAPSISSFQLFLPASPPPRPHLSVAIATDARATASSHGSSRKTFLGIAENGLGVYWR